MLSPLLTPAAPSLAAKTPAKSPVGQPASANDDSQADDFAKKLDDATAQPTKAPDARPRDKLPVRGTAGTARTAGTAGTARTAGTAGTAGHELAKAQPELLPAQVEGKESKTERTLPPERESEGKDLAPEPTPQGVAALLAELQAAAPAATAAAGLALSASDRTDASPGRRVRADETRLLPGSAAGSGADANTAIGEATPSSLLGHNAAVPARREGTGADSSREGSQDDLRDRFAQQLSAASAQDGGALRADGMPTASNPLATAPAFASSSAPAPAATATEAQLPATPGSAQFGAQLGAQISTFVRDGVEHARLHLNPAEMGPVSVQIQLDGQTAMVHLSAENAHTRQALEQALPLLAGSLREAGLTLSGGGVFEQARQGTGAQADSDAGNGGPRGRGDDTPGSRSDDGLRSAGSAAPVRRRGVVDLVA